jgi:hypothetical protein
MIKDFKFFEGRIKRLSHYNDPYIPLLRTPPGSYYDRTINPDLYGGVRLSELSDRVQQIVRSPEYIPAGYVQVPITEQQRYDNMVIRYVRSFMRGNTNWRGYEEAWIDERNEYVRLKILGGINIGGMMHITYEITTHHTTSQRYRVSVPLINLQRRG